MTPSTRRTIRSRVRLPLTPLAGPPFNITYDVGLPVPNVENLYLNGILTAVMQNMPGILNPYVANDPAADRGAYKRQAVLHQLPVRLRRQRRQLVRGCGHPVLGLRRRRARECLPAGAGGGPESHRWFHPGYRGHGAADLGRGELQELPRRSDGSQLRRQSYQRTHGRA